MPKLSRTVASPIAKTICTLAVTSFVVACAGHAKVSPPPKWFTQPPRPAKTLVFVGDATQQSDAETARDLAVQKALFSLSLKVGAKIESNFESSESETNGQGQQSVSLEMSIAGEDISARGVTIRKTKTIKTHEGFDAYAMIEWPKAEYEAVLRGQKNSAERALEQYLKAKDALTQRRIPEAMRHLKSARGANPGVSISLSHADYRDTRVLAKAIDALAAQAKEISQERAHVCALGVICEKEGKAVPCNAARRGAFSHGVSQAGRKVAATALNAALTEKIVNAGAPELTEATRNAGCLIAVQFRAELLEKSNPFIFIHYSARASVYDVDSGRITATHEIPPTKEGHVKYKGAMKKGFDKAQAMLVRKLQASFEQEGKKK
jgi:hypothetical protein